mgnify:CR=1 FL=1
MKAYQLNFYNALILLLLGLLGIIALQPASSSPIIPIACGAILSLATPMLRVQNHIVHFIVRSILFMLLIALIFPLWQFIQHQYVWGVIVFGVMLSSSAYTWIRLGQTKIKTS